MKNLFLSFISLFFLFALASCGSTGTQEEEGSDMSDASGDTQEESMPEVTLSSAPASVDYPDAILEISSPSEGATINGNTVSFNYDVTNYELGAQTSDADQKPLANSGKGQHIHLILNNNPYYALYEPTHEMELDNGHYVALSFLSRSYHESVKQPEAFTVSQFTVGEGESEEVDLSAPMLFYSRPKGTYTGADTETVLFDFYLVNTEIGANGNQVRVTVNGDHEFMVDEWAPMVFEGLPMGENTVKIELVDSEGNLIDGPFNSEERTFTLEAGEEPAS
ncbi:putative small lipoprotein YifL [Catalinimonas alkaloidigena]|uniref:LptM family lipoprotein n=1 Tax=Catalinimonas alkaloidigena TaxID=1075417 RepID=UPI0024062DD9|nr:phosphopeptide-binding protein [Catalinimonas alkaloidigena]MDF9801077.1 putative small lipoprotein YifL [Catalinimonas alkaloidigena]